MKFNIKDKHDYIKDTYIKRFPTDELGTEIKSNVTFNDLFNTLDHYQCPYRLIGVDDSLVRERCFTLLAEIMQCDYNYIYYQWLKK
jgi:hypothetical protein